MRINNGIGELQSMLFFARLSTHVSEYYFNSGMLRPARLYVSYEGQFLFRGAGVLPVDALIV